MARKVFPSNPNTNDIFTSTKGKKFQWNGKVWKRTADTNVESMTLDSSADEKLALHGSDNPLIRFREGSTAKGNLHWNASAGQMRLVNQESSQELRVGSSGVEVTGNLDVTGNLEVTGTTTFNGGTLTLGDAASDNVVFGADVNSSIIPNTDDTYDLGSSSQEWRNLFIDGTANIDTLSVEAASTFLGTASFSGDVNLGNGTSDTITATGRFDSSLVPSTDDARDLGTSSLQWRDLYIDGTGNIDTIQCTNLNGSILTIGGDSTLGDATSDTITANGRFDSDLVPSTDGANALGTTALRWSDLFADAATITNDASVGGNLSVIGNMDVTGTLTYEDVTNIDSVGVVTARSGLVVSSGGANITGGITGDLTGDVTGNADTATTLATARNIGGVSFDGSANITLPGVNSSGNQDTSGNAATATQLATSRTLSISSDGTGSASFDGSGNADIALTLANSGVTANTYGSSSAIPILTVNAKGLITSASTTSVDSTTIENGTASVSVSSNGPITSTGNHDFTAGIDVTGNISCTGTVTASSDVVLKKNISTIDNALDKVLNLRGVEFDYVENDEHSIGVIAQEVEEVLPDLVHTNEEDDLKSVAYQNLTAVLIEAVKELTSEVNTLKAELNTLKGE